MHPEQYDELRKGLLPKLDAAPADLAGVPATARSHHTPRAPPRIIDDDDCWLTSAQTRARFGNVSNMAIWRWVRDSRVMFPAPVKINGRNYWRLGDLRRWQAERASKTA